MPDVYVQLLAFTVDGQAAEKFAVFRMTGREAISELFRFEIDVLSDDPDIDLAAVTGRNASLTVTRLEQTRRVHGMVERLELRGATPQGQYVYRAILVPRLHCLKLSRQNQIHGTTEPVSVRKVLEAELTGSALKGAPAAAVSGRLGLNDLEFMLYQSYPERDYIVQYEESDFAFVSRLCEHYGIFYFFTHDSGRDVVVFADGQLAFPTVSGPGSIAYRTASGLVNADEASVYGFTGQAAMVPAQVCLRDYNYRIPDLILEVDETVDPAGHGVVVEYGSHFRTPEEGRDLARVRAQELASRKLVFDGASDSVHLTAGAVFNLTDHFRDGFNAGYVITWIEHEATQAMPGIAEFAGPGHETSYRNRFECLPKNVEFRPTRATPKPRMAGLSNATVDAAGSGQRAELDASGRYKIRQQFDQRGEAAGQSSRYVRKAEPYGGANTGMHFPLLKGTEVILACVNGDPDRPIIVGAMQNEQYPSVVNARSNTTNRMRTTSGTLFEIDDGPASGGGGGGGGNGATLAPQQALAGVDPHPATAGAATAAPGTRPLVAQRAEATISTTGSASSYARLHTTAKTVAYWRLGSEPPPPDKTEDKFTPGMSDMTGGSAAGGGGIFEFTAGDQTSLVEGSSYRQVNTNSLDYVIRARRMSAATHNAVSKGQYQVIAKGVSIQATTGDITDNASPTTAADGEVLVTTSGNFTLSIGGSSSATLAGSSFDFIEGTSTSFKKGSTFSIFLGSAITLNTGASTSLFLGNHRATVWIGMSADIGIGLWDFRLRVAPVLDIYVFTKTTWNGVAEIKAGLTSIKTSAAAKIDTAASALRSVAAACQVGALIARNMALDAAIGMLFRI